MTQHRPGLHLHEARLSGLYTSKAALKKKHVDGIFSINQHQPDRSGLDLAVQAICNLQPGPRCRWSSQSNPSVQSCVSRSVQERPRTLQEDEGPTLSQARCQTRFQAARPVPFTSMEKIDAELDRLQSLGIITPVDFSQWAAPIVVVKKPGGKVRICADYSTGLNAALEPNHYPLPVPDDIFTKLNGCRYFSVIDLSDAYLQVEVDDDSKQLLTINTHRGLFRFNRLAPGVKSAPGAFQQLMNSMVADLEGVDTFLDDIFVANKTEEEHHKMLNALFQRLQAYGFVLREEKCNILQPEVKNLAHIVDENGLRSDPSKVEAIVKMPPPKDVTTLRSFLGAVNFYANFVPEMRQPLDALLKKDAKFVWNSECQKSFRRLEEVLQSDLLLTHYDPSLDIIVAADASQSGIGACLLHRFPDGSLKSVAHASRSLTPA
ncbi:uncharacterized protein K02A2.6-like [Armigeres subalbatus]|uniref:uncharacterized protein K02A2.6-like n=1 Tax=Armigeres subalbatus TaxID=124917 RepID=UPI002ED66249